MNNAIELTGHNLDELMQQPDYVEADDMPAFVEKATKALLKYQIRPNSYRSEVGRTSAVYTCPVCGTETRAFIWSVAGSGKKCSGCKLVLTQVGVWIPNTHKDFKRLFPNGI